METAQVSTQEAVQETSSQSQEKKGFALKLPKKPKKRLKWLLIALAAVAAVWWLFLRSGKTDPTAGGAQYIPTPVTVRDLAVAVTGSGAVAPIESYQVSALTSGEILSAPFEVGDWIEKGDLLYQLDAGDAETAIQQAQLSLRQAQLSYNSLADSLTPSASAAGVVQKVYVQTGDLVSVGSPIADITDTSTMTVTLPFHSADAAQIAPGQSAQVTIAGTLETLSGTVESVSTADLVGVGGALVRQVKIRVSNPGALTTSTSATAAVGNIACAASGSFEENMRQTVTAQTSGEITALHVTAGSKVSVGTALATIGGDAVDSSLSNASIAVENAQLSLQRAQDALENYTITSPISGTVIEKNYKAGDKMDGMESGALAVIFDLSSLKLQINVNELDIDKVQAGQTVEITAQALPGQVFTGQVERVSINGTTTNGFTTYPVTITVSDYGELKPGMNVSATIQCETAKDVLCVPVSAVNRGNTVLVPGEGAMSQDGAAVADPSKLEERTVTLGLSDDAYIEVTSGLEEGEIVLLPIQAAGVQGAGQMAVSATGG